MLLTVKETATLLKVNKNFVYNLIKQNKLKCVKIGSIKIKRTDLEEFINNEVKND